MLRDAQRIRHALRRALLLSGLGVFCLTLATTQVLEALSDQAKLAKKLDEAQGVVASAFVSALRDKKDTPAE